MGDFQTAQAIPSHLKKYVVEQNYDSYTSEDQEVWRFIMHQLHTFLEENAHSAYSSGLSKTGISTEFIPKISDMDKKLQDYGWRAVPVSGFIPPAAFMDFQARSILPIACDMRTVGHILYTPAPDIVHEAAGHAPILIDPDFTKYLKSYGEVASKSILSSEDLALYEAIRDLSDVKESPQSTPEKIKKSEQHLDKVTKNMSYVSEAQYLGRMNWWTAEYGLIGDINQPKIFGAGLLSSIDEARNALTKPKKIPLTTKCLNYSYDITEQQPQLFVTPDFETLTQVLDKMSQNLAFKMGGEEALERAQRAQTVCSIILEGGLCYSGVLLDYECNKEGAQFFNFKGPVQISNEDGFIELIESDEYNVSLNEAIPVISVQGGPKHFEHFPIQEDFKASRVPEKKRSEYDLKKFETYTLLRTLRSQAEDDNFDETTFKALLNTYLQELNKEWLIGVGLLELALSSAKTSASKKLSQTLDSLSSPTQEERKCINLAYERFQKEGLL